MVMEKKSSRRTREINQEYLSDAIYFPLAKYFVFIIQKC